MADSWPWASYGSSSPSHSVTQGHLLAPPLFYLWLPILPCSLSSLLGPHSCCLCMAGGGQGWKLLPFPQTQASVLSEPVTPSSGLTPVLLGGLVLLDKPALAAPRRREIWPQR